MRAGGEGRDQCDDVAERSHQEAALPADLGHAMADSHLKRVGSARRAILHEFDSGHQPTLPDLAHMTQRGRRTQQTREQLGLLSHVRERLLTAKDVQVGQGHGAAQRIAL